MLTRQVFIESFTKLAFHPMAAEALINGALGAGWGTLTAGEGHRARGALTGAAVGAASGAALKHPKVLSKLDHLAYKPGGHPALVGALEGAGPSLLAGLGGGIAGRLSKKEKKAAAKQEDSAESADKNVSSNKKDNASTLKGLFDEAKKTETQNTKTMDKVLPGKIEKETANPLLKVAFVRALREAKIEKNAAQIGAMYTSFSRELDAIQAA